MRRFIIALHFTFFVLSALSELRNNFSQTFKLSNKRLSQYLQAVRAYVSMISRSFLRSKSVVYSDLKADKAPKLKSMYLKITFTLFFIVPSNVVNIPLKRVPLQEKLYIFFKI